MLGSLSPAPNFVVLSVGGIDVREIVSSSESLPGMVLKLQANLVEIVQRVVQVCPRVIIVLPYRPCYNLDCYGVYQAIESLARDMPKREQLLNQALESVYSPVLLLARALQLPVVDCANSFDIRDSSLYVCQTEPSAMGGAIISQLLAHVVLCHNFAGHSLFYQHDHETGDVLTSENADGVPWVVCA